MELRLMRYITGSLVQLFGRYTHTRDYPCAAQEAVRDQETQSVLERGKRSK